MFPSYKQRFVPSYTEDFGPKYVKRESSIRTGSSSGQRKNNPHPSNAFMIWRCPRNFIVPCTAEGLSSPTPNSHLMCPNSKASSTYQVDYLRPASRVRALTSAPAVQPRVNPSLMSTQNWSFQVPMCSKRLQGNTTRYGCNEDKHKAACGGVPTISIGECQHYGQPITSYIEHYRTPDNMEMNTSIPKLPQVKQETKKSRTTISTKPSWLSQWIGPA